MDIAGLIQSYGYLAVAAGAFLEGETVLVTAGAIASHGYLSPPAIIVVAALAGFLGDQLFFFVGRRYGSTLLSRFPSMRPPVGRVTTMLERYHVPLILAVRFLYGLRIAGPIAIGMSDVPWMRFVVLNFIGAVAWATVITGVGYGIGQGLIYAGEYLSVANIWIMVALVLSGVIIWLALK